VARWRREFSPVSAFPDTMVELPACRPAKRLVLLLSKSLMIHLSSVRRHVYLFCDMTHRSLFKFRQINQPTLL